MDFIKKIMFLFLLIILLSFNVIASTVDFYDKYTTGASTSSDGITWGGTDIDVYLNNYPAGTKVICWDWDNDGAYSFCVANDEYDFYDCIDESSTLTGYCYDDGICWYWGGALSEHHSMDVYWPGFAEGKSVNVKYYADCGIPSYGVYNPSNSPAPYKFINYREYDCNRPEEDYRDQAEFGTGIVVLDSSISCSATYGCDISKDDIESWFGELGISVPDPPCSKLNGESCNDNDECLNDHCSVYNICDESCGDDACDSNEWCIDDPCIPSGTCGGNPDYCNTCGPNHCESNYWYKNGASDYCFNRGDLCCDGDPTFGQYFCKLNDAWAECTAGSNNIGEEMPGGYYCTEENGIYKWRQCPNGCCTSNTCTPPTIKSPQISVSPISLYFEVGY